MSLTTTRQEVADALSSSGYSVYAYPSETMIGPCIVMVPGSPYFSQPQITTIGSTDYLTTDITLEVTIN